MSGPGRGAGAADRGGNRIRRAGDAAHRPRAAGGARRQPVRRAEHTTLHIVFLAATPAAEAAKAFDASRFAPEEYPVIGREVFLHLPNGIGRAKLPPALPLIRGGTARNWRTVQTLAEMTRELAAQS